MSRRSHPLLQALTEATATLITVLESDDVGDLPSRMARQLECFQAVQAEAARGPTWLASELAQTMAAAEKALPLARARLVEARKELEVVRNARAALTRRPASEPTPRFISRRV